MELLELNDQQKEAVKRLLGPLLILAGAGSGKTRVLTVRIAELLKQGVEPYRILAITFTNKAAKEMRNRVNHLTQERGKDVWISTFHSFCVRILRMDYEYIGYKKNFQIYDSDDSDKLLKECLKELNMQDKQFSAHFFKNIISKSKDQLVGPDAFKSSPTTDLDEKIVAVYRLYQQKLRKNNAMDFDDLIFNTVTLFRLHPELLLKYQERFQYIMVDEYQDTNLAQYELVKLLSMKHQNICVVGDDDQSIYSFRGADVRNILEFEKDFANSHVIKLEQNYRSNQNILNLANSLIQNNRLRKDKKLWTASTEQSEIILYKAFDEVDESRFIVEQATRLKNEYLFKDMAVLYRTNAQSRALEDSFIKNKIPYRIYGGTRFYERKEIKDILAYLKIFVNPADELSLKRIINVPKRSIGLATLAKLSEYASLHDQSLLQSFYALDQVKDIKNKAKNLSDFINKYDELIEYSENHGIADIILQTIHLFGYQEMLENEKSEEANTRLENLMELVSKGAEFDQQHEKPQLAEFLEEIALLSDIDNYDELSDAISMMTLHSAKGLEFPIVFLSGLEEGLFPSFRSMDKEESLEEERRLFYVGITRAKHELFLSYAKSRLMHGQMENKLASRFLKEIPEKQLILKTNESAIMINKAMAPRTSRPLIQTQKPYASLESLPPPEKVKLNFEESDMVMHHKYGIGKVLSIQKAGADYEVSVEFKKFGCKKFMAGLSKLQKAESKKP